MSAESTVQVLLQAAEAERIAREAREAVADGPEHTIGVRTHTA